MREQTVRLYRFDELADSVREKVLQNFADVNVDYDWFDFVYDDAKNVGLEITSFDIDRRDIGIKFLESAEHTADKIMDEHGDMCGTYQTAKNYLVERDRILENAPRDENGDVEDEYELDQALDAADAEFLHAIGQEYLSMLSSEYDYRTSAEAITATILRNEYEFTENGKQF